MCFPSIQSNIRNSWHYLFNIFSQWMNRDLGRVFWDWFSRPMLSQKLKYLEIFTIFLRLNINKNSILFILWRFGYVFVFQNTQNTVCPPKARSWALVPTRLSLHRVVITKNKFRKIGRIFCRTQSSFLPDVWPFKNGCLQEHVDSCIFLSKVSDWFPNWGPLMTYFANMEFQRKFISMPDWSAESRQNPPLKGIAKKMRKMQAKSRRQRKKHGKQIQKEFMFALSIYLSFLYMSLTNFDVRDIAWQGRIFFLLVIMVNNERDPPIPPCLPQMPSISFNFIKIYMHCIF